MDRLSPQVLERISGPSWSQGRDIFLEVSEALLAAAPETYGQLTTIYVKYTMTSDLASDVYAVVWVKTSKQLVVGMALPDSVEDPCLRSAPSGTKYKGLTKYFVLHPGDAVPQRLKEWATQAYELVLKRP